MRHRYRILSWFLAVAMVFSMVPPVAVNAASNVGVSAGFAEDVTLSENASGYEASMSVDLDGLPGFSGYGMRVDWTSMKDYVKSVRYSVNEDAGAKGRLDNYDDSRLLGPMTDSQRYLIYYASDVVTDLEGAAIIDFSLDSGIPAGRYPVDILVAQFVTDEFEDAWDESNSDNYLTATGTLTVRNADGTVPGESEEKVYTISSVLGSDAASGSVSFDKTEAKAGETVTATLNPAAGYELDAVTATDTTNSASVELTKVSDTEYTFVMPEGNVQVNVTYKVSEPTIDDYAISAKTSANGAVHTNGVESAKAGETVEVFVKPNEDYETVSVAVTAETGVKVDVSGGTEQSNGFYKYTFVMPESDVTVDAVFRLIDESNRDEVTAGHILTKGTVLTGNNNPLAGAKVQLVYETGGSKGQVAAETVTGADGSFILPEVSGSYTYKLQASYDTGILQGKPADPGYIVYSAVKSISMSAGNVDGKGEVSVQTLTISLYYEWDVDNDGSIEQVHAGKDDRFLTPDDFYQTEVGGQTVNVYADGEGKIQSEKAYYLWEVDTDGVKEQIFVGGGYKAGTENDYYMSDVDHDPKTADIEVYIGVDRVPATSDDTYTLDINNDGKSEQVFAGSDGLIATEDDWYLCEGETVFAGEDKIAGTSDDWYLGNGDGHGEDETIFIGKDRVPHTGDDFYKRNVDGNGEDEAIYAGEDARFNTSDDYYEAQVGGESVKVHPGSNDEGTDPYEFGRENDHYAYVVGNQTVDVRVGADKTAGTNDDEFDWIIKGGEGNDVSVTVIVGPDGIPGTEDDFYEKDVDGDGKNEIIHVGPDGIPGTEDDFYEKDVDGDGKDETIHVGPDGKPGTEDDFYEKDVDGDGKDEVIHVGPDGLPGTEDDFYEKDVDSDGKDETIHVGPDGKPGTEDDFYEKDVDGDGKDETIHVGPDGKPGTEDDFYEKDVDGDGKDEVIHVGPDGLPGTEDDFYEKDVDGDGKDETIHVGPDGLPGTEDDFYEKDVDSDGKDETIHVGPDGKPGTEDDFYEKDVDGDGKDETIHVGPDGKPGTEDDFFEKDVIDEREDEDGDGKPDGENKDETIHVGPDGKPGTKDDYYEYDVDGDGEDEQIRAGEDKVLGTKDDEYDFDIDSDGKDEVVYVGDDTKPGTSDDWYYPDITFNAGSGTVNGSKTYTQIASSVKTLPSASQSGYRFNGWSKTQGGSTLTLSQVLALKSDTTLYANYSKISTGGGGSSSGGGGGGGSSSGGGGGSIDKPSSKLVTFESNGGSAVKSQSVKAGGKAVKPADPTRKGFEFTGWYADASCTKAFDFNTAITKATTVYAGWKFSGSDLVFKNLTRDHIAYIAGYDDGLVHPGESMTRAQAAQMFYNLLTSDTKAKYNTAGNSFTDIAPNAWYNKAVSTLASMGILSGYGDGRFGPNDSITRAQFASICVRLAGLDASGSNSFTDVSKSHWAYGAISVAADAGWISGYGNGKFGPNDDITRAQVVSLMNRMLERSKINASSFAGVKTDAGFRAWPDNADTSKWYYNDLIEAGNGHKYKTGANGVEIWTSLKAAK